MKGAILIGENLLDQTWFSQLLPIGSWTEFDRLLEPQLEPAAEFAGNEETGIEIRSNGFPPVGYNAIALLGTDIGLKEVPFGHAITIERLVDAAWVPVKEYTVYELNSVGSPRSLVAVFDSYVVSPRYRIRWYASDTGKVGAVIFGRAIRHIDLADAGWGIRYIDQASASTSEAGQIYTGEPQIVRELLISAATMSPLTAFGVQPINQSLSLPNPILSGDVVSSGDWVGCGNQQTGSATWSGLLTPYSYSRVDFQQRQIQNVPDSPVPPRWGIASASLAIGSGQGFPTGVSSVYGQAVTADLVCECARANGQSEWRILSVQEVDFQFAGWEFNSAQASYVAMAANHGRSRPVIVLIRPTDPVMTRIVGVYGYITGNTEIRQVGDSDVFSTSLQIREQR